MAQKLKDHLNSCDVHRQQSLAKHRGFFCLQRLKTEIAAASRIAVFRDVVKITPASTGRAIITEMNKAQ